MAAACRPASDTASAPRSDTRRQPDSGCRQAGASGSRAVTCEARRKYKYNPTADGPILTPRPATRVHVPAPVEPAAAGRVSRLKLLAQTPLAGDSDNFVSNACKSGIPDG